MVALPSNLSNSSSVKSDYVQTPILLLETWPNLNASIWKREVNNSILSGSLALHGLFTYNSFQLLARLYNQTHENRFLNVCI